MEREFFGGRAGIGGMGRHPLNERDNFMSGMGRHPFEEMENFMRGSGRQPFDDRENYMRGGRPDFGTGGFSRDEEFVDPMDRML